MDRSDDNQTRPAGRIPSISMVAREAGVSTATVSRIINGVTNKASPETVERVREVVARTGYRPSSAGQTLRRRESRLVALIAANLSNPAMSAIAASVEVALREKGYVMVLCDSHDQPGLQDEYLREMKAQAVRGFVLLGAVKSPVLDAMDAAGEPMVFVNRTNPYGRPSVHVGIDNEVAGREVAVFLHGKGVTEALVIHGALASSATAARVAAFRAEFRQLTGAEAQAMGSDDLDHLGIGYDRMREWLAAQCRAPQAAFCLSDLIAYGAGRALREGDHRGCLLTGFDDNPLNDWVAPDLASVRVPYEEFGPVIVQSITRLWDGERDFGVHLPHRLVVRNSTLQT